MKVLFTHSPDQSVYNYLVTMGWALRTAGHEVCFACRPGFAERIAQAGHTALPVGRDHDPWRLAAMFPEAVEQERAGVPEPYDVAFAPDRATWDYMYPAFAAAVAQVHKVENFPLLSGLVAAARRWEPDLVIWDSQMFAGAIAAGACGAAHARLLFGADILARTRDRYRGLLAARPPGDRPDPLADWLGSYAREYGGEFSEEMITGDFTVDQFPASLQFTGPGRYVRTRYVPYGGQATVPPWLREPPKRPRVALTLGLSATAHYQGYAVDVEAVLAALADLDVEVVATVAAGARGGPRRVPGNARVLPYVPLQALAPTCSVVIHHAGAATMATASLHGVPQLALPLHFDQPALAARLAEQGAGLSIHSTLATGPAVRDAVTRLLTEPSFRDSAHRLREEMVAAPSPNEVVPVLERIVAER